MISFSDYKYLILVRNESKWELEYRCETLKQAIEVIKDLTKDTTIVKRVDWDVLYAEKEYEPKVLEEKYS